MYFLMIIIELLHILDVHMFGVVCVCYRFTKPHTFADCVGEELPYGWEQAMDPRLGIYYINHLHRGCTSS